MSTADIRYHSSDGMDGLGELSGVMEPVAVVIRPDGSVDAYGYLAVIDQRGEPWCNHDTAALDADGVCECGAEALTDCTVCALPIFEGQRVRDYAGGMAHEGCAS